MATPIIGPGLASAGPGRVVTRRSIRLLSVLDGWWARVLERADVVSEGGRASEPPGSIYYGSTHLRCTLEPRPHSIRALSVAALARLMLADPHARLRLLRLARREAVARAPGPLGVLEVELAVRPSDGRKAQRRAMVDVEIEVSAPLVDAASGQSFR